jgi:hypothetical protein
VPHVGTGWVTFGGSYFFSFTDPTNPPFVTGTAEGSAPIPEPVSLLMLEPGADALCYGDGTPRTGRNRRTPGPAVVHKVIGDAGEPVGEPGDRAQTGG